MENQYLRKAKRKLASRCKRLHRRLLLSYAGDTATSSTDDRKPELLGRDCSYHA